MTGALSRDSHRDGGKIDRNKRDTSAERRAKIAEWNKMKKDPPAA